MGYSFFGTTHDMDGWVDGWMKQEVIILVLLWFMGFLLL